MTHAVIPVSPADLADAQSRADRTEAEVLILADPHRLPDSSLVARLLWWQHQCGYAVSIAPNAGAGVGDWLTRYQHDSDYLDRSGFGAWRGAAAGTLAVPRQILTAAGGLNAGAGPGWQLELAYRLAQRGAVFVADPEALSDRLPAIDAPADLQQVIPLLPERRPGWRETHTVPVIHVVVDCATQPEAAATTLDGVLDGEYRDVAVTVVGASPSASHSSDSRVSYVDVVSGTSAPVPFRLEIPAGCVLQPFSIRRMLNRMRESQLGLYQVLVEPRTDGSKRSFAIRLVRTAAIERSLLVGNDDALDDTIDELFGSTWVDGRRFGIRHCTDEAGATGSPDDEDDAEEADEDDDGD